MTKKNDNEVAVNLHKLKEERDRIKLVLKYFSKSKTRTPKKSVAAVCRQLTNIIKKEYQNNSDIHVLIAVKIDESLWKRARGII